MVVDSKVTTYGACGFESGDSDVILLGTDELLLSFVGVDVFCPHPVRSKDVRNNRNILFFIKIEVAPLRVKYKYTIIKNTEHCKKE
jgi:hypothetical protein